MSGGIAEKITGTLSLLLFVFIGAYPQEAAIPVRIMFYNVENLFDIYDDPLTDDDEFLPSGLRRWNYQRYNRKVNSVYKTILAAGGWEPPAVVAFCEIENRKVLEDLVYRTYLSKYNYEIIHEDSPDERGIDVCLIYRGNILHMIDYQYLKPLNLSHEFRTRNVLYARFMTGTDTIHLLVNHWPSRRGGVLAGEALRKEIAEMVRCRVDSIATIHPYPKIIIIGDFNASPDDQVIGILNGDSGGKAYMVNLSENLSVRSGTYRYMGTWEIIDQVLVSDALINSREGFITSTELFSIFRPDFLLKKSAEYPGLTPFSTFSGYRYQGGYSDHLPILLDLVLR
jgi:hypothetical protein